MRKLFFGVLVGLFLGGLGVAIAQTYSQFSYLRVLNILDVRTSIQNQDSAESVVVDDNFSVTGTSVFTGAITVPSCSGCGGGSPGGSDTQVQYNDGGAFGGDSGLTFNETNDDLTIGRSMLSARLLTSITTGGRSAALISASGDATGDNFLAFYEETGLTNLKGSIGYAATGDNNFYINNSESSASIVLRNTSGGQLLYSPDAGSTNYDLTPASGSFTITYTNACTVNGTQAARYYIVGTAVTLTADAMATCTGDTTLFDTDAANLPAAIRPSTSSVFSPMITGNNNGTTTTATIELHSDGEVVVNRCGAVTGTCDGGAWTNAGNRALDAWTISYVR